MRALLLALALPALPGMLCGQAPQPEVRLDVLGPRPHAVHAGLGLTWAFGNYARVGAVGGWGIRAEAGTGTRRSEFRGDLIARVTLDPFRQQRFAFSLGGGITVRERPYLLAVMDFEGPAMGGWIPALQVGAGGGLRAGLVLRRAVEGRR